MSGTTIADLQIRQEDPTLEAKVYRKWILKNPSETKEQAFCCMLIDKQGYAIQATMDLSDLRLFDSKLRINTVYKISNFICENTNPYMQTLENKISLSFGRITSFVKLPGKEYEFPNHYFQFVSYNDLSSRIPYRDENTAKMIYPRLTDYLGCIRSISHLTPSGSTNTRQRSRRNVAIENLDGNMVELTIWGELATHFDKDQYDKLPFPAIIAVSSCTVSRYRGVPQLATTSATHYYINPRIQEAANAYARLKEKYGTQPPLQLKIYRSDNPDEEKNRNRQTLATLIQQDLTNLENVRFMCEAMLTNIVTHRGWHYPSCTQCNNASKKVNETYVCKNHGKQIPTPYRYNFKATATDGTASAEFTFFTEAGEKITGISCSDLRKKFIDSGEVQLPKELTDTIGQNHIFQIQFATRSQKGATRFVVKDILDINSDATGLVTTTETYEDKDADPEAVTCTLSTVEDLSTQSSNMPDVIDTVTTTIVTTIPPKTAQDTTTTAQARSRKRSLDAELATHTKKKRNNSNHHRQHVFK